jgi:sortase A
MMSRRTKRAGRIRRWIALFLFVGGAILVGIYAWSLVRGRIYQERQSQAFERKLKVESESPSTHPAPPEVKNGDVLGRLRIPRLRLSAMVREGAGEDTLGVALGHIPGTALPGRPGNVGVAGHRDTLFRGLRNIRKDDIIEFETLRGKFDYQVESTRIVTPRDVDVLNASAQPEITLVTCYPFYYVGSAPDRFVVKARQVGIAAPQPPSAPILRASVDKPKPTEPKLPSGTRRIEFEVAPDHSRQLTRGISFGVSRAEPGSRRVEGWMWVMPDRRTIWLHGQSVGDPVIFFGGADGRERKLVITNVGPRSVKGYLLAPVGVDL